MSTLSPPLSSRLSPRLSRLLALAILAGVTAGLKASVQRWGPKSVVIFSCSKATNEVNYIAQKFIRGAVGSNNIDSCNRT